MLYIYANSILLFYEMMNPLFGYMHGVMLSLGLGTGWIVFLAIGRVAHRTARIVYYNQNTDSITFEFFSFYKQRLNITVKSDEVVSFTKSNIEGFNFIRLRKDLYMKIYFNLNKNLYKDTHQQIEFKEIMTRGTGYIDNDNIFHNDTN